MSGRITVLLYTVSKHRKPSPLDCLSESLLLMDAAWRERKRKKERAMVVPFAPHYCWRGTAKGMTTTETARGMERWPAYSNT